MRYNDELLRKSPCEDCARDWCAHSPDSLCLVVQSAKSILERVRDTIGFIILGEDRRLAALEALGAADAYGDALDELGLELNDEWFYRLCCVPEECLTCTTTFPQCDCEKCEYSW